MADFSTLIATLQATIKTNYNQEITGQILQDDLLAIVDAVNRLKQDTLEGYAFYGAPLADGASIAVTQNTFFLVAEGEYEINGSTIEVDAAGVSVIVYDSVNNTTNWYTLFAYDTTPTANSRNAITSGAVKIALDLKADKSATYTKTETDNLLDGKVDKEAGKGLSSNDYTDAEKTKLGALPTAAELSTDLAAKQDKDTDAVAGNVAVMDAGGSSVDGGVALADLATKAEVEAVEQEVAQIAGEAGLAEAVIDTDGAGTEQEFTFRKSGGDGGAYYRKIKGKTIVVGAQLASNDAEAVETTGANQWDEEYKNGYYGGGIGNTPTFSENAGYLSSKNVIPAFPETTYYVKGPSQTLRIVEVDANGIIIKMDYATTNATYTTKAGCAGLLFSYWNTPTYNHDICINLSNPAINGQYFPYWKRTLQLGITTRKDTDGNVPFADGMKGAGTAADWADKVGGEKRIGSLDLGSLNWGYRTPAYPYFYSAAQSQIKKPATNGTVPNIICAKYVTTDANSPYGGSPSVCITMNADGEIIIYDPSFGSDTAALKAALSGVMLDYALATPVPFTWAEPLNLGVKVDENGTERAVAPEGATAPSAPFVADTTYTMSVARMVEKLQNL